MTQASVQELREFTPHSPATDPSRKGQAPPEILRIFADGLFEGAGPALTTLINRPVTMRVREVGMVSPADLLTAVPLPWILAELSYARGLTGKHWLILAKPSALALGRAVAGEGEGEEFSPAHEDAIRETVSQIFAVACSTLMPVVARSLSFAPVTVGVVEGSEALPPDLSARGEGLWLVRAEAEGPDGFRVALFLTIGQELAREIISLGAEVNAPAPAEEPSKPDAASSRLDLILDVTLPVTVELGRARMQIQDILKLAPGSVIELEKSAGDPVELYINDRPIAKGEVVVIEENFGVRLTSIVTASERIRTLR